MADENCKELDVNGERVVEKDAYWFGVLDKIIANLTSAKMWMFLGPFLFSCWFGWEVFKVTENPQVYTDFLTSSVALVGTVIVVRETFKVAKVNALKANGGHEEIKKMKA